MLAKDEEAIENFISLDTLIIIPDSVFDNYFYYSCLT